MQGMWSEEVTFPRRKLDLPVRTASNCWVAAAPVTVQNLPKGVPKSLRTSPTEAFPVVKESGMDLLHPYHPVAGHRRVLVYASGEAFTF